MVNLQARADLRAAIRRLMFAAATTSPRVEVNTGDVALLLALVQHHLLDGGLTHPPVAWPTLHPGQR